MNRLGALALALLLLAACDQQSAPDPRQTANPEKYSRDRELCRGQVNEYMRTRRNIDDSRRDVLSGDSERYGQSALPNQMEAYGDTRSVDTMMASCMESRGWAQPKQGWWQRLGTSHTF